MAKWMKARGYIVAIGATVREKQASPEWAAFRYRTTAEYYLYEGIKIIADIDTILKMPPPSVEAIDLETFLVAHKKNLNMLRSLFHDLEEAHKAVGEEAFAQWCADNFVPLRVVFKMLKLLPDTTFMGQTKERTYYQQLFRRARDIEMFRAQADKPPKPAKPRRTRFGFTREVEPRDDAATFRDVAKGPVKPPSASDDTAALKARIAELEAEIARRSTNRSKAGRKAIFGKAMTAAERMRRMRAARKPS